MRKVFLLALLGALAFTVAGCGPSESQQPRTEVPGETPTDAPADNPAAGLRLAPGLYDIEDGTKVQAIGTLEYRDIEGGLYAVVDGTSAEGDVVAVIANEQEFLRQLEPLNGKPVNAIGTRAEGASIRMAGPEIVLESIEEMKDTPDNISE